MWQAWLIGILGLWLMVAAFLGLDSTANLWNNLLVGMVVATVGYTFVKKKPWQAWVCMVVGVWLIIAAFIPSLISGQGYLWNDLVSGLLIAIGGFGALGGTKTA